MSFPSAASVDDISDIEDAIEPTPSDDDTDEEHLQRATVSGIRQLETIHACISCNKNVRPINSHMGECETCNTTQKLSCMKQAAKLIVESGTNTFTLRAHDEALKIITNAQTSEKEISAQDLLYAPEFNCTFNKFNILTNISRQ